MTEGTPKIVALEDNEEDFSALRIACKQFGRPVELIRFNRAEDLADAVSNDKLGNASMFLLDLRMPGGGGLLALRVIRSNKHFRGVPVVIFSTSNNPLEVKQCYENEATAFHIKNIETPKTLALLKRIFSYWLDDCVQASLGRRGSDVQST